MHLPPSPGFTMCAVARPATSGEPDDPRCVAGLFPTWLRVPASLLLSVGLAAVATARPVPIPDPGFGGPGGIARIAFDVGADARDFACAAVIDGARPVLAGLASTDAGVDAAFVRLDAGGVPDPAFGSAGDGRVSAGLAPAYPHGDLHLARALDGRLPYLAHAPNLAAAIVGRLHGDGKIDTSFNGSGHRFLGPGFFVDGGIEVQLSRVLPDADGGVLVLGAALRMTSTATPQICQAVGRLTVAGATDTRFGNGRGSICVAPSRPGQPDRAMAYDGALLADGRIVLAGVAERAGGSGLDMSVIRLLPDGRLDPSFGPGHDGWAYVGFDQGGDMTDAAFAVTVDAAGRIVLAGTVRRPTSWEIGVARLLPSGDPDPAFGLDGRVLLGYAQYGYLPTSFSVYALAGDRILVGGSTSDTLDSYFQGFAAVLTSTGRIDPRFGEGGLFVHDALGAPAAGVMQTARVVLDGDHLYLIGDLRDQQSSTNTDFAATRFVLPLFHSDFE
ncbi:MAG: delta-60 repeat domain-containing protein [Dokdonella sp.]|nr:delta-60 repeat domain-containing protein [Dokdonella sp.]